MAHHAVSVHSNSKHLIKLIPTNAMLLFSARSCSFPKVKCTPSFTALCNLVLPLFSEKENCNLRAKVKHLSSRIRQLMDVMYSAKIKVPDNLPPTSTYTPGNHCKWNGKAGDKKVELLLKSVLDKSKSQ